MNRKTRIIIGIVLAVKIGPRVTMSGRRRTFFIREFDLFGGDIKVTTINIRSVKLHTPEPLRTATGDDGGDRANSTTMTTTVDTNITDTVSIQVFEAPALDPLNDETLRVVVAQTMDETTSRPLSPLADTGGSVVRAILSHVMNESTVDMPTPPPITIFIPVGRPPLPVPPILAVSTTSSQHCFPGV